jgi:two-component system sensor histidine kinase UhpB
MTFSPKLKTNNHSSRQSGQFLLFVVILFFTGYASGQPFYSPAKLRIQIAQEHSYERKVVLYFNLLDAFRRRQLDSSRAVCNEIIALSRQKQDHATEAKAMLFGAQAAIFMGKVTTAKYEIEAAKVICEHSGNQSMIGFHQVLSGLLLQNEGKNEDALKLYNKGLLLMENTRDTAVLLASLTQVGRYYFVTSDFPKFLEYILRIKDMAEKARRPIDISNAFQLLSLLEIMQQPMDTARFFAYSNQCLAVSKNNGLVMDEAEIYTRFSALYKIYEKYDIALEYGHKAADIMSRTGAQPRYASLVSGVGYVYLIMGKPEEAIPYFERSLSIVEKTEISFDLIISYRGLGRALFEAGINQKGLDFLLKALELAIKYNYKDLKQNLLCDIAEAYRILQKFDHAYDYANKCHLLKDSLYSIEKDKKLDELRLRNEYQRREDILLFEKQLGEKALQNQRLLSEKQTIDLKVLGLENILQLDLIRKKDDSISRQQMGILLEKADMQLQLKQKEKIRTEDARRRNLVIVSLSGLLLLAMLLLLLFRNRQQINNQLTELQHGREIEKIRNEIAQDIHDEVGSGLTKISLGARVATMLPATGKEELTEKLLQISSEATNIAAQLSDIIFAISPRYDTFSEVCAYFREQGTKFLEDSRIEPEFNFMTPRRDPKVSPQVKRQLFMIYREALHNILKHANGQKVTITFFTREHDKYELKIVDDGIGFDLNHVRHFGNGLAGIRIRAANINANAEISAVPGRGTTILISGRL